MNQLNEKYLENMKQYNNLENLIAVTEDSDERLLGRLHEITEKKRRIQKEQDTILATLLLPLEKKETMLTPEKAEELSDFAEKLTKYSGNIDGAVSYRIHKILLDYASKEKNYDKIAEHLYGCGLCEYYADLKNLGSKKCWHFTEAFKYWPYYEQMSNAGRMYYERCLCNHILNFTNNDPDRLFEEGEKVLRAYDKIEEIYGNMAFNSKKLRFAVCRNMLTASECFRKNIGNTPENTQKQLRYAQMVWKELEQEKGRDISLLAQYPGGYYAEFHAGKIDIDKLLCKLEKIITVDPGLSRRANCLRVYSNTSGYITYLKLYSKRSHEEIIQIINEKVDYVMQYTELLKKDESTAYVNKYLANFIEAVFKFLPYSQAVRIMLQVTISQHKPTCIHTLVVAKLCEGIIKLILDRCPEKLAGTGGYSAEQIPEHSEELERLMHYGALLHDIGKYYCFDVISNASRKLEDIEFNKIKQHPVLGYEFIKKSHFSGAVEDCILRHHVWHNRQGGYPENLDYTENQPLIDILSAADSIEAATDWFGRSYANPKTISMLLDEFESQRDTRYAGFVIDVLKQPEGQKMLEHILNDERRKIVCRVWRDRDGIAVNEAVADVSDIKENVRVSEKKKNN